jgi:cellulase/cellobiase CelA1
VTNDWGSGFCAALNVANGSTSSTRSWRVELDMLGGSLNNAWNANTSGPQSRPVLEPVSWNASIPGGGTQNSAGFCANKGPGNTLPVVVSATGTF